MRKEEVSAYMDGESVEADFAEVLASDPGLKQKWGSYHTIRSVMQGEEIILGNDFSARMEALLENEEIKSQAADKSDMGQPQGLVIKLKRWYMPLMQAGIAASVCLATVLGVNMFYGKDDAVRLEQSVLQTLPLVNTTETVSYNAPANDLITLEKLDVQQQKIDTLQDKNIQEQRSEKSALQEKEKAKVQTSTNK